jgi:hypothetical protein
MGISGPKLEIPNERSRMTFYALEGPTNYRGKGVCTLVCNIAFRKCRANESVSFFACGYRDIPVS